MDLVYTLCQKACAILTISSLNALLGTQPFVNKSYKLTRSVVKLINIVTQGWPEKIKDLPPELQPYWTFQEAITVADGLLLQGTHIIIPNNDRPQILIQIHEGHLGIQKCLQRAKATVYWPRLYDELKDPVANCAICLKYSASNRKDSTKIGLHLVKRSQLNLGESLLQTCSHMTEPTTYLLLITQQSFQ